MIIYFIFFILFSITEKTEDNLSTAIYDDSYTKTDSNYEGETYELSSDETMKTAFFDLVINKISRKDEFMGYVPEKSNYEFLILNITIKNTTNNNDPLPMFYNDFKLRWNDSNGEEYIYPEYSFTTEQLPDEYTIFKGKSKTGNLIFTVPKEENNLKLIFIELFTDDITGDTYEMYINSPSTSA